MAYCVLPVACCLFFVIASLTLRTKLLMLPVLQHAGTWQHVHLCVMLMHCSNYVCLWSVRCAASSVTPCTKHTFGNQRTSNGYVILYVPPAYRISSVLHVFGYAVLYQLLSRCFRTVRSKCPGCSLLSSQLLQGTTKCYWSSQLLLVSPAVTGQSSCYGSP